MLARRLQQSAERDQSYLGIAVPPGEPVVSSSIHLMVRVEQDLSWAHDMELHDDIIYPDLEAALPAA